MHRAKLLLLATLCGGVAHLWERGTLVGVWYTTPSLATLQVVWHTTCYSTL